MANQPQNRDADRRVAMGVGLFRVGMLVFITGMVFFVGNASVVARAAASGGAAAALIGVVFYFIGRRQGGRYVTRR